MANLFSVDVSTPACSTGTMSDSTNFNITQALPLGATGDSLKKVFRFENPTSTDSTAIVKKNEIVKDDGTSWEASTTFNFEGISGTYESLYILWEGCDKTELASCSADD